MKKMTDTTLLGNIGARKTKRIKMLYSSNELRPNNALALIAISVFVLVDFTSLYQYYQLYNSSAFVVVLRSAIGSVLLNLPATVACTSFINAKAGLGNDGVKFRVAAAVMAFMLVFVPYSGVTMLNAVENGVLYESEDVDNEYEENEMGYNIIPAVNTAGAEDKEHITAEVDEAQAKACPVDLFAAIALALLPLATTFLSIFVSIACTKPFADRRKRLLMLRQENAEDVQCVEQALKIQTAYSGKLTDIRLGAQSAADNQRSLIISEGQRLKEEARMYISRHNAKNPSEVSTILAGLGLTAAKVN